MSILHFATTIANENAENAWRRLVSRQNFRSRR